MATRKASPNTLHQGSGFAPVRPEPSLPRPESGPCPPQADQLVSVSYIRELGGDVASAVGNAIDVTTPRDTTKPDSPEGASKHPDWWIVRQMMEGNFDNICQLTELATTDRAYTLIEHVQEPVLVLPNLKTLTAKAARVLAQWEGEEIRLPVVENLDEDTFVALYCAKAKKVITRQMDAKKLKIS